MLLFCQFVTTDGALKLKQKETFAAVTCLPSPKLNEMIRETKGDAVWMMSAGRKQQSACGNDNLETGSWVFVTD